MPGVLFVLQVPKFIVVESTDHNDESSEPVEEVKKGELKLVHDPDEEDVAVIEEKIVELAPKPETNETEPEGIELTELDHHKNTEVAETTAISSSPPVPTNGSREKGTTHHAQPPSTDSTTVESSRPALTDLFKPITDEEVKQMDDDNSSGDEELQETQHTIDNKTIRNGVTPSQSPRPSLMSAFVKPVQSDNSVPQQQDGSTSAVVADETDAPNGVQDGESKVNETPDANLLNGTNSTNGSSRAEPDNAISQSTGAAAVETGATGTANGETIPEGSENNAAASPDNHSNAPDPVRNFSLSNMFVEPNAEELEKLDSGDESDDEGSSLRNGGSTMGSTIGSQGPSSSPVPTDGNAVVITEVKEEEDEKEKEKESENVPREIVTTETTLDGTEKITIKTQSDDVEMPKKMRSVKVQILPKLKNRLAVLGISTPMVIPDETEMQYQVIFAMASGNEAELILNSLCEFGVGVSFGTVSILNTEVSRVPEHKRAVKASEGENDDLVKFSNTVTARLMLERVVEQTNNAATFSFDFLVLCIVAALLAGVGLATNNPVIVVASMLVSPLMGPILAITFGTSIKNWAMVRLGLVSEFLALGLCILSGFIVGLGFAPYGTALNWPTGEMASRGAPSALIIGLTIAIPSGAGVALSVLGNNTSSLVGVAISASLLPPMVNCGMCLAYAIVGNSWDARDGESVDRLKYLEIGGISFFLTILNILCIYFVALGLFYVKEVAPIPGKTDFWKHLHHAREYDERLKGEDAEKLKEQFQQYRAKLNNRQLPAEVIQRVAMYEEAYKPNPLHHTMSMFKSMRSPETRAPLQDLFTPPTPMRNLSTEKVNEMSLHDSDTAQPHLDVPAWAPAPRQSAIRNRPAGRVRISNMFDDDD